MIIEVLKDKYYCGSNRGITYIDEPGILEKLNRIIEWSKCSFPKRLKESSEEGITQVSPGVGMMSGDTLKKIMDSNNGELTEEAVMEFFMNQPKPEYEELRDFLNNENGKPELKPGDMFMTGVSNQIIACDSQDRLVLCVSESGPLALKRLYSEIILKELEYLENDVVSSISEEDIEKIPESLGEHKIKGEEKRIMGDKDKKIKLESDYLFYPVDVYYSHEGKLLWNENDIPEDCIKPEIIIQGIISWYFKKEV